MWSWRLDGTRARAMQPASAMEANICAAVSQSTCVCSMSTVSQAKPARARKREAVMLPSDSQVPTDDWPAFNARLTGLARIRFSSVSSLTANGWDQFFVKATRRMLLREGVRNWRRLYEFAA